MGKREARVPHRGIKAYHFWSKTLSKWRGSLTQNRRNVMGLFIGLHFSFTVTKKNMDNASVFAS